MKVYFTASIVAKKQYLPNYTKIVNILKTKGYDAQADHILGATEDSIRLQTRAERLGFHKRLEKWIRDCDFMVAETSFPSISVGYEISMALQYRKPVLILYCEGDPPSLFAHHTDEKLVCEKYTTNTLEETIEEFINYVHGASDTRFTFFITNQIAGYLEKVSKKQKIPKSVYLRELIEAHMEKFPQG